MSHTIRDKQKLKARASKIQFYNRLLLSVAR